MGKKKDSAAEREVRLKAAAMREAQAKSERRTRNIIIGVVSVLILAIVAAIIYIIASRPGTDSAQGAPAEFDAGQGISVSADGISASAGTGDNDLDFYYDYTCGGCLMTDSTVGPYIFEAAHGGDFTFVMHPVLTSAGAYNTAATAAVLAVAAEEPANFEALHEALVAFSLDAMMSQETEVLTDLEASKEAVATIAAEQGISEAVIASFDTDAAMSYLQASTAAWTSRDVEGRETTASPEFVYRDAKLSATGDDGQQMFDSLMTAMSQLRGE